MRAGDIHWVDLPLASGHEQQGRRPAIVVQNDNYGADLPVVLVIPLTTARAAKRFAGTITIHPTPKRMAFVPQTAILPDPSLGAVTGQATGPRTLQPLVGSFHGS